MSFTPPPTSDRDRTAADRASRNGHLARVPSESFERLVVLAYIAAVAMPPIGLLLAIPVALRRDQARSKHWVAIVALCVVAGVMWTLIISSGALTATSAD